MTEPPKDPLQWLNTLLGLVILMFGIAILMR